MFAIENVRKVFPLLEDLEKEQYRFTSEEKQIFYRSAFHMESFDTVREMIFQTAMLEPGTDKRQELLRQCAENLPESPCDDAAQIEGYIFQLQHMCYEKEKAMKNLEDILKKNGIAKETKEAVHKNVQEGENLESENEIVKNGSPPNVCKQPLGSLLRGNKRSR